MIKIHTIAKSVAILASAGMLMTACNRENRTGSSNSGANQTGQTGTGYGNQKSGTGGAGDTSGTGLYGQPGSSNPKSKSGTGSTPDMSRTGIGGAGMDTGTAKMDTSKKMDTTKHMGKGKGGKKGKHGKMKMDSTKTDTSKTGAKAMPPAAPPAPTGTGPAMPSGKGTGGSDMPSGGSGY